MPRQPMGGGLEVGISSGRPREIKTPEERQTEENLKKQQATIKATNLLAELQGSETLFLLVQGLADRLYELAAADPQCQAYKKIIVSLRSTIAPVTLVANHMARHSLGPQLHGILQEIESEQE